MSQYKEELFEEGFVESVNRGIVTVIINPSVSCEECSAKHYCKTKDSDVRKLLVKESLGVEAGDKVRVSIKGKNLLLASLFIYGNPLIILLITLVIGMNFFQSDPELFSFLFAILILGVYFFILWIFSGKLSRINEIMPEIVSVYKD